MGDIKTKRSRDSMKEKFLVRFGRRGFDEEDYKRVLSTKQNGVILLNRSFKSKHNFESKTVSGRKKINIENSCR